MFHSSVGRVIPVTVAMLLVSACTGGGSTTTGAVDVATVLSPQLASIGIAADPESVRCDSPATLAVGTSISCTFTANGQPVGMVATVKSADGSTFAFDIATQAREISQAALAQAVSNRVAAELGAPITATTCAGALEPKVGAATSCTLKNGAETRKVTVSVDAITGGQLSYTVVPA